MDERSAPPLSYYAAKAGLYGSARARCYCSRPAESLKRRANETPAALAGTTGLERNVDAA
jgi:hypothetical protein